MKQRADRATRQGEASQHRGHDDDRSDDDNHVEYPLAAEFSPDVLSLHTTAARCRPSDLPRAQRYIASASVAIGVTGWCKF